MSTAITIKEQRHRVWKIGTCISAILALILGITFWNLVDLFWVGIFRLAAFIFFSLAVFGALKSLQNPLTVTITRTPEHLLINYEQDEEVVQEEQFDRSSIDTLTLSTETLINRIPFIYPQSGTIKVSFNDGHQGLNLFEYSGRTLFFEETEIKEVLDLLRSKEPTAQP